MIQVVQFSRMNTDADDHSIKPEEGEYTMMENLVLPKNGKGQGYSRESLDGTIEIPNTDSTYPSLSKIIGSYEDKPNSRMYYFVRPDILSDWKRIMVYDSKLNQIELVLRTKLLDWTEETQITGISVIDGVIYWSDPTLRYYRIQDETQLIDINYYARGITDTSTQTYYFQADSAAISVHVSATLTGIKTANEVLTDIADQFNNNPVFSAHFFAVKVTNSEVINITSLSQTGNWLLSNNSTSLYYYFATNYDPIITDVAGFSLYPVSPIQRPELTASYDSSIAINNVGVQNWQFAYRYIFLNDQISVFSPYSEFQPSVKFPEDLTNTVQFNKIQVFMPILFGDDLKHVELAARINQTGDFFVVKSFERNELFLQKIGADLGLFYTFTGTEVQIPIAVADMIKQQESQPKSSIDLQLVKNKLFVIDNLVGFNTDPGDFEMLTTIIEGSYVSGTRYLKDGGRYNFALRFFDPDMRTDGTVHKNVEVNIPKQLWNPTTGKLNNRRQYVQLVLSGRPPEWAKYYTIVRSDELFYEQFTQAQFYIHYWVRPMTDAETYADFTSDAVYYAMWGQVYLRSDQDPDVLSTWKYVHLQQPTNLPFTVRRGMIVDLGANFPLDKYGSILDVIGPMIVIDKPPNTTVFLVPGTAGWFEIFEDKKQAQDNSFYEIGAVQLIIWDGTPNRTFGLTTGTATINVYGGLFYKNNIYGADGITADKRLNWKYDFDTYTTNGSTEAEQGIPEAKFLSGYFESYSPSFRATQLTIVEQDAEDTVILEDTEFGYDFGYVNDSAYATRNLGRPAPLLQNVREEERPSTIRWSNDYVANAFINGLHTFEPLNIYPLPLERGPITKLQRAGEDVMLAIHSSGVTSLYIGKGIIRSADLSPTLVTTEGVIGTDSQLKYSYGTTHATSVCQVDGNVYFWDGNRNEPVRYGQNGLTPMATTFATRTFFKETIPATFGNVDNYTCISQFDKLLNVVFFTFYNDTDRLTIGFSETNKVWLGKFSFVPEYYGVIGDYFIGFKGGVAYLHNADPVNNNTFYGVEYPTKVALTINPQGFMEKLWDGMMVDSNVKWNVPVISNNESQLSDLVADDFVWRDQVYYADFFRDLNTDPQLLSPGQIALRHGKFLTSQTLSIELEVNTTEPFYLHAVTVAATLKPGHLIQNEK